MKLTLGDMTLEIQDAPREYMTYEANAKAHATMHAEVERMAFEFLRTAERCYIERHGAKPERTTREEF